MAEGLNLQESDVKSEKLQHCDVCIKSKLCRTPFGDGRQKADRILGIIHSDVCGTISPSTYDGYNYYVSFTGGVSGFVMLYLIKTKDEVFAKFKECVAEVENTHNAKVSMLRCDNGGEYDNTAMKQWCKMKGIKLDFTPPYTPQLNPVSERYNKTVWEKIRALMYKSGLDKKFWGLAAHATF